MVLHFLKAIIAHILAALSNVFGLADRYAAAIVVPVEIPRYSESHRARVSRKM